MPRRRLPYWRNVGKILVRLHGPFIPSGWERHGIATPPCGPSMHSDFASIPPPCPGANEAIGHENSIGSALPTVPTIPATPTPIAAAAIPTVDPLGAAQSRPTPAAAEPAADASDEVPSSNERSTSGLCALGLAPLFLIGGLVIFHGRRGRREAPK